MLSIPAFENNAIQGVSLPAIEIAFSGGNGGGIGGSVASTARNALTGSTNPWATHLVALSAKLSVAPGVNALQVRIRADEQAPKITLEDTGQLSLGYNDNLSAVFTGQVDQINHALTGQLNFEATDAGAVLSRLRINQSYEQQSAGDIVSDLADQAGVDTGTIEDGLSFAFYAIDDRRNAYQHIAELAKKSGYQAYITPDNKLYFGPVGDGDPVQTFTYGQDIVSMHISSAVPTIQAVQSVGEGAAGSEGSDAWSWIIKDPSSVQAEAGDGDVKRIVADGALRSNDAASQAAAGLLGASMLHNIVGEMVVPGAPAVTVGAAIEIKEAPQDALNGTGLVRAVEHAYTKRGGFTTRISFSKTGEGGFNLSDLGGLF